MEDLAIGIDLGTTNSCVALYIKGQVKILENSEGGRITPSFVFFTNLEGLLVGEHAKRMAVAKPEFGVYEIKRLVGRKYNDPSVEKNLQYFPFKVHKNQHNEPTVLIQQSNRIITKTPQELCTIILEKIKRDVQAKLGHSVNKVVITVPAYFNMSQREVTLAAAKAAGFTVLKLLNEPTAAALSYYFEMESKTKDYSLVYDLGGGTFDVAILKRHMNNIEIISVDGDTHLGGHDFDNIIVDYVCMELIKHYLYNPKLDKSNMRRLHTKCEDAKKALSVTKETIIVLNGFVKDYPSVQINITRAQFEELSIALFERTIKIVDNCLKNSGLSKKTIKEVILSGGSTRIPKIQQMISDYFDGNTLSKFVNPDECVAEGAALQAAMLSTNVKQEINEIRMIDVVPLSLGISTLADRMSILIKRNTPIPVQKCETFVTVEDQQRSMSIVVFEGERKDCRKNRHLGEMIISDITPAPPGQCQISVTMMIDQNGILMVKAKEVYRNNSKELKINYARGDKSENEVSAILKDIEDNKKEDEHFEKFSARKAYLIRYCISVRYNIEIKQLISNCQSVYDLCGTAKNSAENMELDDEEEMELLMRRVKRQCEPIAEKYNFGLIPKQI